MSLICCPSRSGLTNLFMIHGNCSKELINRLVPCVLNYGGHRGARWMKPYNVGEKEYWNKGIFDYRYKEARRDKVAKVKIPKFDEMRSKSEINQTPEEIRSYQKEQRVVPPRPWKERAYTITHTSTVFDPYVPKEGDAKSSLASTEGVKDLVADKLTKKTTSYQAVRKIRSYLQQFDPKEFAQTDAVDLYNKVHNAICKMSSCENNCDLEIEDQIFDWVTEKAYAEILHNIERKTIRWQLVKHLEEACCVRARCEKGFDAGDIWAQVTIRFHTQQILAIYDRFGRLTAGSENIVKDVLEYVVFENHLSDVYSQWRIHAKIIPDWVMDRPAYTSTTSHATYRKPTIETEKDEKKDETTEKPSGKKVFKKFVTGRKWVEE